MSRLVFSVAFLLLVAGCTGSDKAEVVPTPGDDPGPAGPGEFSDTTGAVEGLVVTDEQAPIEGAEAAIASLGVTTRSDAAGRFVFSHVAPGTYDVHVAKLGFEAAAKRVEVVAGAAVTTTLVLQPLAVDEAYPRSFNQKGLLGCAIVLRVAGAPAGASACGLAAIVTIVTGQDTSSIDKFALVWKIEEAPEKWEMGVFEMSWRSSQALSSGLFVYWEVNMCPGDPDLTFGSSAGRSPLRLMVDREKIAPIVEESSKKDNCLAQGITEFDTSQECNAKRCNLQSRVFSEPATTGQAVDVAVAAQQSFEQWVTNFYGEPGPVDYSALADG